MRCGPMMRQYFYPRSPCGERRLLDWDAIGYTPFLSTLSLRRATRGAVICYLDNIISIHALLAESDADKHAQPPRRPISIHALLAESDVNGGVLSSFFGNFYPRSPCGERHTMTTTICIASKFLSTLSLRRATFNSRLLFCLLFISIHALLAESDMPSMAAILISKIFLSTLSLRRATVGMSDAWHRFTISIHALLAESDLWAWMGGLSCNDFYPRSPCGERLVDTSKDIIKTANFYPRSPCGERPAIDVFLAVWAIISIHALLAESDVTRVASTPTTVISIHALLAESDLFRQNYECFEWIFLSTLSLRRATPHSAPDSGRTRFLSTLSLRRATWSVNNPPSSYTISIHALLAESDVSTTIITICTALFLSTLSLRRATISIVLLLPQTRFLSTLSLRRATGSARGISSGRAISIHALLAESDPGKVRVVEPGLAFLSTLSLRRATRLYSYSGVDFSISIHALLAESDSRTKAIPAEVGDFYPRSPCGERRADTLSY